MTKLAVAALALAGCNSILGLESGTELAIDAAVDAKPGVMVTLAHALQTLTTQVDTDPVAPTATAYIPTADGMFRTVPLDQIVDHAVTADVGELTSEERDGLLFVYTVPDEAVTRIVALGVTSVASRSAAFGAVHPELAPSSAQVTLAKLMFREPWGPADRPLLTDIGGWWNIGEPPLAQPTGMEFQQPTFASTAVTPLVAPGPPRIRTTDLLFYLRYSPAVPGYIVAASSIVKPFDQGPGNTLVGVEPEVLVEPASAPVPLDVAAIQARLAPFLGQGTVRVSYQVLAAVGADVGLGNGIALGFGDLPISNGMIGLPYGQLASPWKSIAAISARQEGHEIYPGVATFAQLGAAAPVDDLDAGQIFAMAQGVPFATTIAGEVLDTDNEVLPALTTAAVTVSTEPQGGTCNVVLFDFSIYDADQRALVPAVHVESVTPSVTLPASVFRADTPYVVDTSCLAGRNQLGQGVTSFRFPYASASVRNPGFRFAP